MLSLFTIASCLWSFVDHIYCTDDLLAKKQLQRQQRLFSLFLQFYCRESSYSYEIKDSDERLGSSFLSDALLH